MAVIITHPELGIYLGHCLGFGFWSKLDAAGQRVAVAFRDEEVARQHIKQWENLHNPDDYGFAEVTADVDGGYVSVASLRDANLGDMLGDLIKQ
jgi:hypothetical protein